MAALTVGNACVRCPKCDAEIDIPIVADLTETDDDRQSLHLTPDMADLWAHSWTHQ